MNKLQSIELNCDLGEGQTEHDIERDALIMPFINRCNIACGGHAGTSMTMRATLINAKKHDVICGAHPSYPDPENFGRYSMRIELQALSDTLFQQVSSLNELANQLNISIQHIKCHGALYNDIESDESLANFVANFVHSNFPHLPLIGLSNGLLQHAAEQIGHLFIKEAFIDRAYLADGRLAPRDLKGAVIEDTTDIVLQAFALANHQSLQTLNGNSILIEAETLCLHSDTPNALLLAEQVFAALTKNETLP